MRGNHLAPLVEDEEPRACGALVYGSNEGGSDHDFGLSEFLALESFRKKG